ncbi:hypothetical protein TTHERM_00194120 (macronuclear) [Tetrahymena thermophila SB210]|uniref:Uncharacterized protein n=1 Tax=Tetrahymena thermophila (strain SB210) TaxID=312017 RepID=Q23KC3_TETTS|nr:hypothetical protein TTHERM_00194120 [Tetrahymena thermophila SB210]EAR96920.1 hypothetical protein TTHERM_00194120 [Tetrahymena thermophila SB210]|eukprot:XP_001017165.1 hypothetical protein TTHERM_00194120 [Tetrahymena thermophila SB210]
MTGSQVNSGDDITKSPSTLFTSNKAVNFSDRNTVPSESDLMFNSSQALMNEGFKRKAILEWEISPIKLPPQKNQQVTNLTTSHQFSSQQTYDSNQNLDKINLKQINQMIKPTTLTTEEDLHHENNLINGNKGQHVKKKSISIQNKILSNILKKSTSNHINEFNKQIQSNATVQITQKQIKQQLQATLQNPEATDKQINQEYLRHRTNTQDLFYFKNNSNYKNIVMSLLQSQQMDQNKELALSISNNGIHYLPNQNNLTKSANNPFLTTKSSSEFQPSSFSKSKIHQRSQNSFYNLLSKIQNNIEQNVNTKREPRQSIKPSFFQAQDQNNPQQNKQKNNQENIQPMSCKFSTLIKEECEDSQNILFKANNKAKNFNQRKNSLNIPVCHLDLNQKSKNSKYFFPSETDHDSTPFSIPKNQFQYHYRDNSYQLIQNDEYVKANQLTSNAFSNESTKNTDTERSIGRQRSNAYSSLAGNLDDIYKKLQTMKSLQNVEHIQNKQINQKSQ